MDCKAICNSYRYEDGGDHRSLDCFLEAAELSDVSHPVDRHVSYNKAVRELGSGRSSQLALMSRAEIFSSAHEWGKSDKISPRRILRTATAFSATRVYNQ
jgi:hypothetical protein